MRTILFRGKTAEGVWLYGDILRVANEVCIAPLKGVDWFDFIPKRETNIFNLPSRKFIVNPDSVGQITNQKDKNGTEIYEGDIVEYACTSEKRCLFVVDYNTDTDMFVVRSIFDNSSSYLYLGTLLTGCITIVGNTTDNPELLK